MTASLPRPARCLSTIARALAVGALTLASTTACAGVRNAWGPSAYADRPLRCQDGCSVTVTNEAPHGIEVFAYTKATKWELLGSVGTSATESFSIDWKKMPGVIVARRLGDGSAIDCSYVGPSRATSVRMTCGGAVATTNGPR